MIIAVKYNAKEKKDETWTKIIRKLPYKVDNFKVEVPGCLYSAP